MNTAPGVCALGWVKYREHISLLVILCIIMYVKKKKKKRYFFFTKPITDYGKMLKYREKYRSISIQHISLTLCLKVYYYV